MTPTDLTPDDAISLSDVVVLGVPSPNYKLDASKLKDGAVVVNVSTFKNLDDSSAEHSSASSPHKKLTYVPLVGRVTVACLERSLLTLYKQYHAPRILLQRGSFLEVAKQRLTPQNLALSVWAALSLYGLLAWAKRRSSC